jgi:preprotein translocase subunit SecY
MAIFLFLFLCTYCAISKLPEDGAKALKHVGAFVI